MSPHPPIKPEWPPKIAGVLRKKGLTQAALAGRLGVSSATISRWMKGSHEPTGAAYISLGNLAGSPEDVYFWERAGIDTANIPQTSSRISGSSIRVRLTDFKFVAGDGLSGDTIASKANAVAIPLVNVTAYGDGVPPEGHVRLSEAKIEEVLMAPLAWCPHPTAMLCIHIEGDSMLPLIGPGAIIAVDMQTTDPDLLGGKIALVSHRDMGFKIARLQRLPSADILVSANPKYMPIDITKDTRWKISGHVLWWVSKDSNQ
jgi:phage repressor protein C with HTH and peptisase S24 domain